MKGPKTSESPRACAGTALVTLLAIAGFCGNVVLQPADDHARWQRTEARVVAQACATSSLGEPQ